MSRLQIVHSLARLQCTKCGAEANATCNCGEAYLPAAMRVAEYDKANPGKSTREAAADLGISNKTVSKARGVTGVTPETVTGRDGKTYKAKREPYQAAPDYDDDVPPERRSTSPPESKWRRSCNEFLGRMVSLPRKTARR
jgi:hypothetical protein